MTSWDSGVQVFGSANPSGAKHLNKPPVTAGSANYAQMSFNGFSPNSGSQLVGGGIIPAWPQPYPQGTDPGIVGPGPFFVPAQRYKGTQREVDAAYDGDQGTSGASGDLLAEIAPNGQVISQVMGLRSNERVHGQKRISRICLPYDHMLARQMCLVERVGSGGGIPSADLHLSPQERAANDTWPTVVPVPVVNFLSACMALVGQPDMTPREFCSMWSFLGPCVGEEGTERSRAQGDMVVAYSRRGPELVKNVWGANLEADTPLYYIVKMVDIPDFYLLDPMANQADVPQDFHGGVCKKRALQMIPWASVTKLAPTLDDLIYVDNEGVIRYGSTIRVYKVEHRTVPPNPGHVKLAPFSIASVIGCSDIPVFVDQPIITHYS
jgi:hypothetical protein